MLTSINAIGRELFDILMADPKYAQFAKSYFKTLTNRGDRCWKTLKAQRKAMKQ